MEEYGSSTYSYNTSIDSSSTDAGFILAFFGFYIVFLIIIYVVYAIFLGMIFKKAGVESWKAWVPVYNNWKMLEIGKQPGWWAILAFVPIVNIVAVVFTVIAMYHIGLSLQKEGWFVLLGIFIPIVWVIWLAVDKSTWEGQPAPSQQPPAAPPTAPQPTV